jgi:signal transduction histidine kinase
MSEKEYKAALQKQGVHSFVIVLPTTSMQAAVSRDLWLRLIIASLASLSVVGLGLAWRNLGRSAELELRLVRAVELNARLKEMNFAAAGLAHETKNPLNIIRGLAQMISKRDDAPPEIREKSRSIVDEADRVTGQLNDFINFSRPREVRRTTVPLNSAVGEVVRALGHDLEDKAIKMTVAENLPAIEADEQLLRQALFNLLLNATQAVERGGEIHVAAGRDGANAATLEIRDNGPGVPAENRTDIFKPYFTTTQKGTGLGLAVVQQIVLAHGWEIECVPNEPRGAVFRISHLRVMSGV